MTRLWILKTKEERKKRWEVVKNNWKKGAHLVLLEKLKEEWKEPKKAILALLWGFLAVILIFGPIGWIEGQVIYCDLIDWENNTLEEGKLDEMLELYNEEVKDFNENQDITKLNSLDKPLYGGIICHHNFTRGFSDLKNGYI